MTYYVHRAKIYADLDYHDLAAGDAYRALLLSDEIQDDCGEYHEQARDSLRYHVKRATLTTTACQTAADDEKTGDTTVDVDEDIFKKTLENTTQECYIILARSLLDCGCLRSSYDFCTRGQAIATQGSLPTREILDRLHDEILQAARTRPNPSTNGSSNAVDDNDSNFKIDPKSLPDAGLARREVYPWNDHEPDRFSPTTLSGLNAALASVAPKCEIRAVSLPTLTPATALNPTNTQLGIFAREAIAPGETVLAEPSLLTATNRALAPLCDACHAPLPGSPEVLLLPDSPSFPSTIPPSLNSQEEESLQQRSTVPLACPNCPDVLFCSTACLTTAMHRYHPALCGHDDADKLFKTPDPTSLYLQLTMRALALAFTSEQHPLELPELRHIWGDFLPTIPSSLSPSTTVTTSPAGTRLPQPQQPRTLPFSFRSTVADTLHFLVVGMDRDPFATLPTTDTWVLQTLSAKLRGTASARVHPVDGRPEVAAVHPLWSLANHSCRPNVRWRWAAQMRLVAREGGVAAGEEVLSHYCDIELDVRERRQWMRGCLGGECMCLRCVEEAGELMDA
ncbi:MAG: hypothetical protein M1825_001254 [Sarcosagium campestre]|nr:MAG: hypothetical protein M1825_001254 [Sarcosagium campestre]